MKQLFIALLLVVLSSSGFASDTKPVPAPALKSFNKSFSNASEVKWSAKDDFYKVNFLFNTQYVTAYYTSSGALMAVTKNILSTQLPLLLSASLKEDYSDYWISELVEVSNDNGVKYYITLENADTKLILQSGSNSWTTMRKAHK